MGEKNKITKLFFEDFGWVNIADDIKDIFDGTLPGEQLYLDSAFNPIPIKGPYIPPRATIVNEACNLRFPIKSVIFHDPRTIIYFKNGDKSVVKVESGETFDKEKGFYAALLKYYMGGRGYFDMMNKWVYNEDK